MIKPSNKVLIGWVTLFAAFASTNLGQASANELNLANPEPSVSDSIPDGAADKQSDVAGAAAAHANNIVPEKNIQLPGFSSQSSLETVSEAAPQTEPEAPAEVSVLEPGPAYTPVSAMPAAASPSMPVRTDDRAAKLEHLVATATKPLPEAVRSQDVATPVETAAQLRPTEEIEPPAALPLQHSAVRADGQSVTEPSEPERLEPTASEPSDSLRSEEVNAVEAVSEPVANLGETASPAETAIANPPAPRPAVDIPVAALPTARVIAPATRQTVRNARVSDAATPLQQTRSQPLQTTAPTAAMPDGAFPRSVVLRPETAAVNSVGSAEATGSGPTEMAQLPLEPPLLNPDTPNQAEIDELIREIDQAEIPTAAPYRSSPAITISNPSGFGADNFTAFVGVGYQERTRFGNEDDGGMVVGIGLGDARENVGVQLSYTVASFGGSRDFGTGGFNAKVHKRLADDLSVALGWEGFATTGFVDFEDSIYGSVSYLVRTRDSIAQPLSRVAVTAGVGNGRFRTEDDVFDDRDSVGVFGSVAVRVVEPVSAIVEWTGQDLAAGLSITPFRDLPLVLLPAVRDITGAGDGSRFVVGAGGAFQL